MRRVNNIGCLWGGHVDIHSSGSCILCARREVSESHCLYRQENDASPLVDWKEMRPVSSVRAVSSA